MSKVTTTHLGRLADTTPTTSRRDKTKGVASFLDLQTVGAGLVRYGLVVVIAWIGAMKFTEYEATGIQGLVANSPLLSWVYQVVGVQQFGIVLGISELIIAGLIAARPLSAKFSALGSFLAVGMFVTTLSFLVTTPGIWAEEAGGFPALSVLPGQFLIKDVVLLGAAVWSLGEALKARPQ
ncbi:MAG: YkgB family protein [Gemmataceae bacterium]